MFQTFAQSKQPAVSLPDVFNNLEDLARQTKFIERSTPGFSATGFLFTLFKALGNGSASFEQMAQNLYAFGHSKSLTKQALHKRCKKQECITFMESVLSNLEQSNINKITGKNTSPFGRILVEDSTYIYTHGKNSEHFRGSSNKSGKTSGVKINVVAELYSGNVQSLQQVEAVVQDKSLGPDIVNQVLPNDLLIRDLGYFHVPTFEAIEKRKAFWLSRLHAGVKASTLNGVDLDEILENTNSNRLEMDVHISNHCHLARLVAFRVAPEVTNRRREKIAYKGKSLKQRRKRSKLRDEWNIYITNIDQEVLEAKQIAALYKQRWDIEIRFRALKQSVDFTKALGRITSKQHLDILFLTAKILIYLSSIMRWFVARNAQICRHSISLERFGIWLLGALSCVVRRSVAITWKVSYDLRWFKHQKRKRTTLAQRLLQSFSRLS